VYRWLRSIIAKRSSSNSNCRLVWIGGNENKRITDTYGNELPVIGRGVVFVLNRSPLRSGTQNKLTSPSAVAFYTCRFRTRFRSTNDRRWSVTEDFHFPFRSSNFVLLRVFNITIPARSTGLSRLTKMYSRTIRQPRRRTIN